jgi:hypothetical protein
MALQRPRSWDVVRGKILRACERTRFADAALYSKPVGGGRIEGLSVRFAEEAVRSMGNVDVSAPVVYDDDEKTIVRVTVTDLEANAIYSLDVPVPKTVERRQLRDGQTAESVRTNSAGKVVYLVRATDDEIANKTNALVSKALRNNVLRLLPADIQEEARDMIRETLASEVERNPEAARKKVLDAFASLSILPTDLQELIGHDVAQCSPAELVELRKVYQAIRDGETTWQSVITEHRERAKTTAPAQPAQNGGKGGRAAATASAVAKAAGRSEREPGDDGP